MKTFKEHIDDIDFDNFLEEMTDEEIEHFYLYGLDESEDDLEENPRIQKISAREKRQRSKAYKRNKQNIKRKQSQYRKTAKYKRYLIKKKRMSQRGRTSSGKLIRKKKVVG